MFDIARLNEKDASIVELVSQEITALRRSPSSNNAGRLAKLLNERLAMLEEDCCRKNADPFPHQDDSIVSRVGVGAIERSASYLVGRAGMRSMLQLPDGSRGLTQIFMSFDDVTVEVDAFAGAGDELRASFAVISWRNPGTQGGSPKD